MKLNKKMLMLSALTMTLTIPHALPVLANENPLAITTETNQEVLTPDLTLPSLSQLNRMRLYKPFDLKEVTTGYINWVSDRPNYAQTLQIQCTDTVNTTYVYVKILDRSSSKIIKETNLRTGQGFNLQIPAGTQWDLYVKGNVYGKASLTIMDQTLLATSSNSTVGQ